MFPRFDRRTYRLHVGYRAEDWSDVWMVIKQNSDQEGNIDLNADPEYDFEFHQNSTGVRVRREPLPGEIIYHSHFDPKHIINKFAKERKTLHERFMSDAHQYLSLNDPDQIRKWERELDNPRAARWQSWFDIAKKYQRRRHPELRSAGDDDDDDDDDDDSAYDSDEDQQDGNIPPMAPPRRPYNANKRKAPGNGRKMPELKRPKLGDRFIQMSGGLGTASIRSASVARSIYSNHDNQSDIFDPSAPEGMTNAGHGHDLDNVQSPIGTQHLGNTREEIIPPFNEWVQNGGSRGSANARQDSDEPDGERIRTFAEINGDLDDDIAFQIAREQSMNPMLPPNGDVEDEMVQAAIEESMNGPRPSIET